MAAADLGTALAQVESHRSELRNLRSRHDEAARAFEVNSGVGAVLLDLGLGWAEDEWGVPTGMAREEADRLRLTWRQSKPYQRLVNEFEQLLDRVRAELSSMFRHRLPLASVYRAATLVTKIRQLDAFLLTSEDRIRAWAASGKKLPVGRVGKARPAHARPRESGFWFPRTLTEWISLVSGGVVLVSLAIPTVRGIEQGALPLAAILPIGLLLVVGGAIRVVLRTRKTASSPSK